MTHTTIPFIAPEICPKDPIQVRFEKFHQDNPEVYTKLVGLVREVKAAGKKAYGIKDLFARLRWYYEFETEGHSFRLKNNFAPLYALLISAQESDLKSLL
jgi:hypothetical protein